ncbi:MAG: hypothetical protein KDA69_04170 [Planctomycetaceae bacterium]|nr:hypothetical protein [Planctomycetaceae bacterium]
MNELRGEATAFYASLSPGFDVAGPLRWQYSISAVPKPMVEAVIEHLRRNGFVDVEPNFDDVCLAPESVNDSTLFQIGFAEIATHTSASFVNRVVDLDDYASEQGYVLEDWSAGAP